MIREVHMPMDICRWQTVYNNRVQKHQLLQNVRFLFYVYKFKRLYYCECVLYVHV